MKYEVVQTKEAYNLSPHKHAYINPYNGCSMGCPFCFWLSQEGWENRIQIKENIAEVLEETLKTWPKDEFIYLGSVCDPFNEIELEYGLSKKCLEIIKQYEIPLLITTSATNDVVRRYADLLASMPARTIIVVELARIPEIEKMKAGQLHAGIENANFLKSKGLEVWATLAPILPNIIELEPVMELLDQEIPIYVDSLQCTLDSIQGKRVLEWVGRDYSDYFDIYKNIIQNQDTSYFEDLIKQYTADQRIKQFPFDFTVYERKEHK